MSVSQSLCWAIGPVRLPKPPPRNRGAGKAGGRASITSHGVFSGRLLGCLNHARAPRRTHPLTTPLLSRGRGSHGSGSGRSCVREAEGDLLRRDGQGRDPQSRRRRCGIAPGSWGGQRASLAPYVAVTGPTGGAPAAAGCLKLPTLHVAPVARAAPLSPSALRATPHGFENLPGLLPWSPAVNITHCSSGRENMGSYRKSWVTSV